MIGDLDLLKILMIILRVSNSGIIFHNTPAANYSSEFKSSLEANLKQFCSINVDENPNAFKEMYKMKVIFMLDLGLKINSLADLPPKEHSDINTEIGIYKLDHVKCAEEPVDQSSMNLQADLKVYLYHVCLVNDTYFGVEDGRLSSTYLIAFSDSYKDSENMEGSKRIVNPFSHPKCEKECHHGIEINSSSQYSLIRNCSHCHECKDYEIVENYQSEPIYRSHWLLELSIVAIYIVFPGYLYAEKMLFTTGFWDLKMSYLLKIPLCLAILELVPETEHLNICTFKAAALTWDIILISLSGLNFLKFDQLKINNFDFNKKFKIKTAPDLVFIVIYIFFTAWILYYILQGNLSKPSEANQCGHGSTENIFDVEAILTFLISVALCFSDLNAKMPLKVLALVLIFMNYLIILPSLNRKLGLSLSSSVSSLGELYVATILRVLKHHYSRPATNEQGAQTSDDTPIELDRRKDTHNTRHSFKHRSRRGAVAIGPPRARGYVIARRGTLRWMQNRRRIKRGAHT